MQLFTVWKPAGWATSDGLEPGAPEADVPGDLVVSEERACDGYTAILAPDQDAVSVFYVYAGSLWGFGLMRPELDPACEPSAGQLGEARAACRRAPGSAPRGRAGTPAGRAPGRPRRRPRRESPIIAASAGSASSSSSAARKIVGLGFTLPWLPEEIHAST